MLADIRQIRASNLSRGAKHLSLSSQLDKVIELINETIYWRWDWEHQFGTGTSLTPTTLSSCIPRDPDTGEPLFPTLIVYPSIPAATSIAQLDSTLALLLNVAQSIAPDRSFFTRIHREPPPDMPRPLQPSVLNLPTDVLSPYQCAQEVVRSVEYVLGSEAGISAPALWLIFSLNMMWKALPPESDLAIWIQKICKQAAVLGGFKIGNRFVEALPEDEVSSRERWERYWAGPGPEMVG